MEPERLKDPIWDFMLLDVIRTTQVDPQLNGEVLVMDLGHKWLLRDGALWLRLSARPSQIRPLLTQRVVFGPIQTHLFITEASVGRSVAL